jgi:Pyruvate/2-oxoacid:ferredoxin oxidoreductase delta subunit
MDPRLPRKPRTVKLDVDLGASLEGFGSSTRATDAHRRIVRNYASPLLLGPPASETLLELVVHLYTDEEAELVANLPPLRMRTAEQLAKRAGHVPQDARRLLDGLAFRKMAIAATSEPRRYCIMPILPGTFESVLMTTDLATRNAWHKKFAEIFERLWDAGFIKDYVRSSVAPLRALPVTKVASSLFMAWPSDRLEEFLEPYDVFAIGHCQCRVAMRLVGRGCDLPTENCVGIGPMARVVIDRGMMRKADRSEILEAKRRAEEKGLVTWMANELGDRRGNVSCSCCRCCCHALRSLAQFSAPGMFTAPHFVPVKDESKCKTCLRCVGICPTGAWTREGGRPGQGPQPDYAKAKCIGCGLCVVQCKVHALELKPVDTRPPEAGWTPLLLKMAPGYLANSARVWARRMVG